MRKLKYLVAIGLIGTVAGCASPLKMGVTKETTTLDVNEKSVLLMSARLSNPYKPDYQPAANVVHVEKEVANSAEDRLNFIVDSEGTLLSPKGNDYLFRMSLPPGKYVVRGISGSSGIFPVRGNFFVPMHSGIEVKPKSVVYIGQVQAKVRERNEQAKEFRAGAVIPLIDQAVTGFSSGTWEISIRDGFNEDMGKFKNAFPVLVPATVTKQILPAFDRNKAQVWWEAH